MKNLFKGFMVALLALTFASCSVKYRHQVEKPGTPAHYQYGAGGFMRYDGYNDIAGDLEIAVADYHKKGSNVIVKLVGAVHIADRAYFKKIQSLLDSYDLVLFEGVKSKGVKRSFKNVKNRRGMYWAMARLIGLTNQMNEIDYNRKNFKHCDITLDASSQKGLSNISQMQKAMKAMEQLVPLKKQLGAFISERQLEDYLKHSYATGFARQKEMNFKQMGQQLEPMLKLIKVYRSRYPQNEFLRNLETKLQEMKESFEQMGKIIIDQRNTYVMTMLKDELKKLGNPAKPYTVAIFYGAAHNADFERRLAKLGYQRKNVQWLKAWKINSRH